MADDTHSRFAMVVVDCSWPYDKTYDTQSFVGHGNRTTLGWRCHTRAAPSCAIFNLGFVIFPCPTHYRASSVNCHMTIALPSVLWRCWLGGRKGIRPLKTEWWGAGVVICLEQGADLHMAHVHVGRYYVRRVSWMTSCWHMGGMGPTCGVHRYHPQPPQVPYWSHLSFPMDRPGARFTKYLTTALRLSYDNAKVTIDLRRTSNLQNILRRAQGFS